MDYSPLIGQVMKIWWLLPTAILGALLKSAWFGKLFLEDLFSPYFSKASTGSSEF